MTPEAETEQTLETEAETEDTGTTVELETEQTPETEAETEDAGTTVEPETEQMQESKRKRKIQARLWSRKQNRRKKQEAEKCMHIGGSRSG